MPSLLFIATLLAFQDSPKNDWPMFLQELLSRDTAIRAAAQERLFKAVIPQLANSHPTEVEVEVRSLMQASAGNAALRLEASAVLGALQAARSQDSGEVFKPIIPSILKQFTDPQTRVRRDAVFLILNLKPTIPLIALEPLTKMVQDPDAQTARAAILSLARLCRHAAAADILGQLIQSKQPKIGV